MSHAIRISVPYSTDLLTYIDTAFNKPSKILIYQHDPDEDEHRVHCHMIVEGITKVGKKCNKEIKSPKTIREILASSAYLALRLPLDYPSLYSVREQGIGKAPVEYMSKGRLEPVYNRGYDDVFIQDGKSKGFDVKKDVMKVKNGKIVIERDGKEPKRKTDIEMISEIAQRCTNNKWYEPREIAQEIVKTWKNNNKRGHSRLLEEWIDAVRYYSKEDCWIDDVVRRYEKKFS